MSDIVGEFNRAYFTFLSSRFSSKHRFPLVVANSLEISQSWSARAYLAAIEQVDKLLKPEHMILNDFVRRLLSKTQQEQSPINTTVPEPAKVVQSSSAAPVDLFTRKQKRTFSFCVDQKVKAGHILFRHCSKKDCERCKYLITQLPVQRCAKRHSGPACTPSGVYPHVKPKTFATLHNANGALSLKVGPGSFPNPLKAYSVGPKTKEVSDSQARGKPKGVPPASTSPLPSHDKPKEDEPKAKESVVRKKKKVRSASVEPSSQQRTDEQSHRLETVMEFEKEGGYTSEPESLFSTKTQAERAVVEMLNGDRDLAKDCARAFKRRTAPKVSKPPKRNSPFKKSRSDKDKT